jgi:hypothetical protein
MSSDDFVPATRADVFAVRRDLALEIVRVQSGLRAVEARIATELATEDDFKRLTDAVERFAGT